MCPRPLRSQLAVRVGDCVVTRRPDRTVIVAQARHRAAVKVCVELDADGVGWRSDPTQRVVRSRGTAPLIAKLGSRHARAGPQPADVRYSSINTTGIGEGVDVGPCRAATGGSPAFRRTALPRAEVPDILVLEGLLNAELAEGAVGVGDAGFAEASVMLDLGGARAGEAVAD